MKFKAGRFFKNAAILTLTSLILRLLGMLFRIWLANAIGSEGMGLYQLILSFYMLAATFAGSGITTAVTRLISEALSCSKRRAVGRIMGRGVTIALVLAVVSSAAVVMFARPIAALWIKDTRAELSLRLLALSLPFMAVSACVKGYFVAYRQVVTPSVAVLLEQGVRMAVILGVMGQVAHTDLSLACAIIIFGDGVAEAVSCIYSVVGYKIHRKKQGVSLAKEEDMKGVARNLLRIGAPITAGRYLTTGLRTAESMMVPLYLAAFCGDKSVALAQYGNLKGMALPLLFFPASFLSSLATLTVPELSGAAAKGDRITIRQSVSRLISVTAAASLLIGGIFALFGRDISRLLYTEGEVGFFVQVLAPLVPLMYLESIATGCLQGLDCQNDLFKFNLIDGVARLAMIVIALGSTGIKGFVLIMAASNILTCFLCLAWLMKKAEIGFDFARWVGVPLALLVPSLAVGYLAGQIFSAASLIIKVGAECLASSGVYLAFQIKKTRSI